MKTRILLIIGLISLGSIFSSHMNIETKDKKALKSPADTVVGNIGLTTVTITYHRPSVRERTIWGDLVKYDKIWRAGANNATTVEFSKDVKIAGKELAAGKYAFFIIPKEKGKWTVIFNKRHKQWGSYTYKESKDALRVEIMPKQSEMTEMLTYKVNPQSISMHWDKISVQIPVE